jgi:hypothetical protein
VAGPSSPWYKETEDKHQKGHRVSQVPVAVILATQEAEIRGIVVRSQLGQIILETLS